MLVNKKYAFLFISLALALAAGLVAFTATNTARAAASSDDGFTHRGGPGTFKPGDRSGSGSDEYLAEALGISLEELQSAYQAAHVSGLEQAVAEGLLTQEQADALAERGFSIRRGFDALNDQSDFDSRLAEALGVSLEELEAARQSARAAALEAAVAAGDLTAEEAALVEARYALQNYIQKDELQAKALGITLEELQAAQEEGQRIPDLLDELGLGQEQYEANLQAGWKEALQQAVAEGVITQEQADQLLAKGFHGFGGPGGHHGGMGDFGGRGDFPGRPGHDGTDGTEPQAEPSDEG